MQATDAERRLLVSSNEEPDKFQGINASWLSNTHIFSGHSEWDKHHFCRELPGRSVVG